VTEPTSELLMFQVGARIFAADVGNVVQIGNLDRVPPADLVEGTSLGTTFLRERGIMVSTGDGENRATLVVDQVLGVRSVPVTQVHPLPAFAVAVMPFTAISGLILLDDAPTFIINLPTLVRERRAAAPT
jgi:chemotaxis signal transduction protein